MSTEMLYSVTELDIKRMKDAKNEESVGAQLSCMCVAPCVIRADSDETNIYIETLYLLSRSQWLCFVAVFRSRLSRDLVGHIGYRNKF